MHVYKVAHIEYCSTRNIKPKQHNINFNFFYIPPPSTETLTHSDVNKESKQIPTRQTPTTESEKTKQLHPTVITHPNPKKINSITELFRPQDPIHGLAIHH